VGRAGHDLLRQARNGGWTNPRLRVQQAEGLRTKALNKELEQRECPALPTPTQKQFYYVNLCGESIANWFYVSSEKDLHLTTLKRVNQISVVICRANDVGDRTEGRPW